jgi:hypothetical protein
MLVFTFGFACGVLFCYLVVRHAWRIVDGGE